MDGTYRVIALLVTLFLGFGFFMPWGIRPLLSHRSSDSYRQFVLSDMYVLVLQIAFTGMLLRELQNETPRFVSLLVFCALVLAVIWRFIVAALDDNAIRGGRQRVVVLFVAPLQILAGPVLPIAGVFRMGFEYGSSPISVLTWGLIAAGVIIPIGARLVYNWALRTTPKPATEPVS